MISKCTNKLKYIHYVDNSTLSTCVPGDHVMDSAELSLEQRLISNKRSINVHITKIVLFSYNKNINFPLMKNNTVCSLCWPCIHTFVQGQRVWVRDSMHGCRAIMYGCRANVYGA